MSEHEMYRICIAILLVVGILLISIKQAYSKHRKKDWIDCYNPKENKKLIDKAISILKEK